MAAHVDANDGSYDRTRRLQERAKWHWLRQEVGPRFGIYAS